MELAAAADTSLHPAELASLDVLPWGLKRRGHGRLHP